MLEPSLLWVNFDLRDVSLLSLVALPSPGLDSDTAAVTNRLCAPPFFLNNVNSL